MADKTGLSPSFFLTTNSNDGTLGQERLTFLLRFNAFREITEMPMFTRKWSGLFFLAVVIWFLPGHPALADDYSNWMRENLNWLGPHPLHLISLPGAHDAAMHKIEGCVRGASRCNTKTQKHPFRHLLKVGIRYFDVRPMIHRKQIRTGHFTKHPGGLDFPIGCFGPTLDDILSQVAEFMSGKKELVILRFGHFYDYPQRHDKQNASFSNEKMKEFMGIVKKHLSPFLLYSDGNRCAERIYAKNPKAYFPECTLESIVGDGGKVIALVDDLDKRGLSEPGLFDSTKMNFNKLGKFSKTDKYHDMEKSQKNKLMKYKEQSHSDDYYLLFWTLTQTFKDAVDCPLINDKSILHLADKANSHLTHKMEKWIQEGIISRGSVPNVIMTDHSTAKVTETALSINRSLVGSGK
jgi:hypothetical protein